MSYWISSPIGRVVVGNRETREYHRVANVNANCQLPEIVRSGRLVGFTPDSVAQAVAEGFDPCWYCSR